MSLDHVGLILGVEMSRLARSNKDWHQLLELCALFRTLIADLDGIYDPAQYNDRLLLGLKGTMSEAELHVLKQRMYQGRLSKARRGELTFALPIGYMWGPDGALALDPDEHVQQTVRLVFQKFEELGTLGGVLRYLADHDIRLGVRVREGPGKGALVWRRANRPTVQMLLKHPLYAGAYVYGRRQDDARRRRPGRARAGRVVVAAGEWLAFLPDRAPAYISWAQYEAHQARLQANRARAEAMGAARDGAALLAGLVVCARCGCRLGVHYDGAVGRAYGYECVQRRNNYGEPVCQHVPGPCLDAFVRERVLAALQPAALELSLAAADRLQEERDRLTRLWEQRLERARYEAGRAARQYHAVEPEHRLVARTLERAWEAALAAQQHLEEDHHRFLRQQPRLLSPEEREAIRHLATDVPALWAAPTTTPADRKALVRQVVERVVVDVQGTTERVHVRLCWCGGGQTEDVVLRPVSTLAALSTYPQLCQRVRELAGAGLPVVAIAERLRAEGYRSARGGRLGLQSLRKLVHQLDLRPPRAHAQRRDALGMDEWWPADLARALGVPRATLHTWRRAGHVRARRAPHAPSRWILWADAATLAQLRDRRGRSLSAEAHGRWIGAAAGTESTRKEDARDDELPVP
ncbi:MAG: recombinase family protein [Chloroflexota bacterium]|nr:recombinase family protein [Chloroflexota bacterium]